MSSRPPPLPVSLSPVPAELLDRAAATVCQLPENASKMARSRAILKILIDSGETNELLDTCIAIDARLDALCRISHSPLLGAWVKAGDERLGFEVLVAAGEAPLRSVGNGYVFEEKAFFDLVLDAAVARGVA